MHFFDVFKASVHFPFVVAVLKRQLVDVRMKNVGACFAFGRDVHIDRRVRQINTFFLDIVEIYVYEKLRLISK
jgi:hypothetical protein